ncbi:MAG TPA: heavy metal-associated domain-containing protein [Urbifossiella sp.]|jgi:copper chaperone CopZ|nr:heavy metal-associated domain-containing protein [Urbifossiella sp.]
MSAWWAVPAAVAVTACDMRSGVEVPPTPVPTNGPNQVVLYVPAMTCASCPDKVAAALAGVSWVDARSIQADRRTRQVKLTVTDRAQFNGDKLKEVIARAGYRRTDLLVGPTDR